MLNFVNAQISRLVKKIVTETLLNICIFTLLDYKYEQVLVLLTHCHSPAVFSQLPVWVHYGREYDIPEK